MWRGSSEARCVPLTACVSEVNSPISVGVIVVVVLIADVGARHILLAIVQFSKSLYFIRSRHPQAKQQRTIDIHSELAGTRNQHPLPYGMELTNTRYFHTTTPSSAPPLHPTLA